MEVEVDMDVVHDGSGVPAGLACAEDDSSKPGFCWPESESTRWGRCNGRGAFTEGVVTMGFGVGRLVFELDGVLVMGLAWMGSERASVLQHRLCRAGYLRCDDWDSG